MHVLLLHYVTFMKKTAASRSQGKTVDKKYLFTVVMTVYGHSSGARFMHVTWRHLSGYGCCDDPISSFNCKWNCKQISKQKQKKNKPKEYKTKQKRKRWWRQWRWDSDAKVAATDHEQCDWWRRTARCTVWRASMNLAVWLDCRYQHWSWCRALAQWPAADWLRTLGCRTWRGQAAHDGPSLIV